jgi:Glutathione-dependent formaldehyde-activating enzyme
MQVYGRCHCGQITYTADLDPGDVSICHCTDCQMLTGSAYRVSVRASAADFRMQSGQPSRYIKTAESGNMRAQGSAPTAARPRIPVPSRIHQATRCASVAWMNAPCCHRAGKSGASRLCPGARTLAAWRSLTAISDTAFLPFMAICRHAGPEPGRFPQDPQCARRVIF